MFSLPSSTNLASWYDKASDLKQTFNYLSLTTKDDFKISVKLTNGLILIDWLLYLSGWKSFPEVGVTYLQTFSKMSLTSQQAEAVNLKFHGWNTRLSYSCFMGRDLSCFLPLKCSFQSMKWLSSKNPWLPFGDIHIHVPEFFSSWIWYLTCATDVNQWSLSP